MFVQCVTAHNKPGCTLAVSSACIQQYLPAGLIGEIASVLMSQSHAGDKMDLEIGSFIWKRRDSHVMK